MKVRHFVFAGMLILFGTFAGFGQSKPEEFKLTPMYQTEIGECEVRMRYLDDLVLTTKRDEMVIVVSHLGDKERKKFGARRLYNAKTYFLAGLKDLHRSAESVVTAEGERVEGDGYLDLFIRGKLELRVFVGKNNDLNVGDCAAQTKEDACYYPDERQFYPCKKN